MRDIKEQAKKTLIDIQIASVPVMLLSEDGAKGIKKQSEELLKIAGVKIEKDKQKENELEEIKSLLDSFKK